MRKYSEQEHKFALRKANRLKSIKILGGSCKLCGENDERVLEFHHPDKNKKDSITLLLDSRWSELEKEIRKCVLLCANCHAELHCTSKKRFLVKNKILKELGIDKCSSCGYNGKNYASLDFHHLNKSEKFFQISKNSKELPIEILISETKKCIVICKKCHKLKHFDQNKYDELKELIQHKMLYHIEKPVKFDRDIIRKLYAEGYTKYRISKMIGCSFNTITYALSQTI